MLHPVQRWFALLIKLTVVYGKEWPVDNKAWNCFNWTQLRNPSNTISKLAHSFIRYKLNFCVSFGILSKHPSLLLRLCSALVTFLSCYMATSLQRSSIQHTDTSSDDNNHKVEQRHWKVLGANTLLFLPLQTCILGSSSVSTMHTKFPFLIQLVHVADQLKHPDQLPNIFRLQIAIMGNGPTLFRFYRYCSELNAF